MDLYVVIMVDILCGTANFVMKQNKNSVKWLFPKHNVKFTHFYLIFY